MIIRLKSRTNMENGFLEADNNLGNALKDAGKIEDGIIAIEPQAERTGVYGGLQKRFEDRSVLEATLISALMEEQVMLLEKQATARSQTMAMKTTAVGRLADSLW
ncbi:hypothetical protein M8C21_020586 [Ambrosia artemisiifolia]|uniref:Uncharacterized protein n=1 Tax=Ambrosia artemisiifolia TaxID=4212 RepID=A0AAD5CE55_AMBAR|nr:hypothetical protein M8C21_020586 [Ambrosia artemisiifolia]